MASQHPRRARVVFGVGLLLVQVVAACQRAPRGDPPALSKAVTDDAIPNVPEPAVDGPRLGAVANVTQVLERPVAGARALGYLHAGARVARAAEPYSRNGCAGGWYPVRPRGFVCATESATTDMTHPTLLAMALLPNPSQPLPYAYARTRKETAIFERDPEQTDGVREVGRLQQRAGLAVVGSWSARGSAGTTERLALLTNGRFVRAEDLQPAQPSAFHGVALSGKDDLPLAFVVKRGVHAFELDGDDTRKGKALTVHEIVRLSGRYHNVGDVKYWAMSDGHWLRHRDVTVVQARTRFPDFALGSQRWIDVSVVTGTLTLYEGKKPMFVTLVSVNRDAHRDPPQRFLGSFEVTGKELTLTTNDPRSFGESFELLDAPWAVELSSGLLLHGAYWHDLFGVEHGGGSVELSPADAERVYDWVTPPMPEGWHGLSATWSNEEGEKTRVVIRK